MVERVNSALAISQQCRLLALPRSSVYRKPAQVSAEDLAIMALIDRHYLARPYYGSRRMAAWLATQGHRVNRKRVQRLMRLLGLAAVYQRPNTSKPATAHKMYPYLLRELAIDRVNQVWCSDITYIPMAKGFLYLVLIMDWVIHLFSRPNPPRCLFADSACHIDRPRAPPRRSALRLGRPHAPANEPRTDAANRCARRSVLQLVRPSASPPISAHLQGRAPKLLVVSTHAPTT